MALEKMPVVGVRLFSLIFVMGNFKAGIISQTVRINILREVKYQKQQVHKRGAGQVML